MTSYSYLDFTLISLVGTIEKASYDALTNRACRYSEVYVLRMGASLHVGCAKDMLENSRLSRKLVIARALCPFDSRARTIALSLVSV